MKFLLTILLAIVPLCASAATHCVRAGASGANNGTDWANAYTALPSTLTRGDTYYIADGTYAGYQFNDVESGTTLITIKKATVADHGTSTGWDDAYGDGVATFSGAIYFMTDDWVFDGQVGGGPGSWQSGHGFKISGSIQINPSWNDVHTWEVGVDNGGDNVTIRHVEIEGTLTPSTEDSVSMANNYDVTVSHVWTRNGDNCPFNIFVSTNVVIEYCSNSEFASSEEHHAEIFFLYGKGGVTIRYNLFRWAESTGGIMVHNGDEAAVHIHGNVFYRASGETWSYGGDGLVGTWTNRADLEFHNTYVVNNTFINIPSNAAGPIGSTPGSTRVWKNNYFYNSDTGLPNGAWTADYNHYQDSGSESETNGTTGTGDPFVDFAAYDFRLEANTTAGENLGSPYNVDMLGNTRTTWTRGAIEFTDGGGSTYAPASTALIDWTPNVASGVGVPGGIPARSTIAAAITATGDSTDRSTEILAAVAAASSGETVKLGLGTFYVSGLGFTQNTGSGYTGIGGKTLRGSGDGTIIRLTGSSPILIRGSETYGSGASGFVTGTPTKGDTMLSVTNVANVAVGSLMELMTEDDDTLPVINVGSYGFNKRQTVLVVSKNVGANTVTFQPALYQTPVKRTGGALVMRWLSHTGLATVSGAGLEDFTVDNTYGTSPNVIQIYGAHGSWIKNVRVKGVQNYGINLGESSQCELQSNWVEPSVDPSWVSPNHGGIILGTVSASLFEDNIIVSNFPLLETQGTASAGNVFGYNFAIQGVNYIAINASHTSGNHCNLWEGNSITGWATDGYFGSAADDVLYRNDLHGVVLDSASPEYSFFAARWSRRIEVVGNQMGRPGQPMYLIMGYKTRFNFTMVGTANNYTGDPHEDTLLTGTLTTRTSDTAGVVTLDTTLGSLAGAYTADLALINVRWGNATDGYQARINADRGTINTGALTVAFSGGSGSALPEQDTAVRVYLGPNGYMEQDDAVAASTVLLGNYNYEDEEIPSAQALGSTTLPDSLYRSSAPSWFTGFSWPPYSPITPNPSFSAIPAGYRYENAEVVDPPVAASSLSATTASSTQINLTWSDNSDNETGFRLERRIGEGSWSTVTTAAANATSYSNTGLTPSTTYEYRVYAVNGAGDSTASNTDSATTDAGSGGGGANATINQLNVETFIVP